MSRNRKQLFSFCLAGLLSEHSVAFRTEGRLPSSTHVLGKIVYEWHKLPCVHVLRATDDLEVEFNISPSGCLSEKARVQSAEAKFWLNT